MKYKYKRVIVVWDINIDLTKLSYISKEVNYLLNVHVLYFMVDFPNKIKEYSQSAIGNLCTNTVLT